MMVGLCVIGGLFATDYFKHDEYDFINADKVILSILFTILWPLALLPMLTYFVIKAIKK